MDQNISRCFALSSPEEGGVAGEHHHTYDADLIVRRAQACLDVEMAGLLQVRTALGSYHKTKASKMGTATDGERFLLGISPNEIRSPVGVSTSTNPPFPFPPSLAQQLRGVVVGASCTSTNNGRHGTLSDLGASSADELEVRGSPSSSSASPTFCDELGNPVDVRAEDAMELRITEQGAAFVRAVQLCHQCKGRVVVIGMGKSGHVGRKIAATMASTGTPSFFLHAAEASHGDLGMLTPIDVVLAISNSGETPEIVSILPVIQRVGAVMIALTGKPQSSLGRASQVVLSCHVDVEACPLNLSPTASSTAQLALGDALAVVLLQEKGFTANDFALRHPGGSLGRKLLLTVGDVMRKVSEGDVPLIEIKNDTSCKSSNFIDGTLPSQTRPPVPTVFEAMMLMTSKGAPAAIIVARAGDKTSSSFSSPLPPPLLKALPTATITNGKSSMTCNNAFASPSSMDSQEPQQQQPVLSRQQTTGSTRSQTTTPTIRPVSHTSHIAPGTPDALKAAIIASSVRNMVTSTTPRRASVPPALPPVAAVASRSGSAKCGASASTTTPPLPSTPLLHIDGVCSSTTHLEPSPTTHGVVGVFTEVQLRSALKSSTSASSSSTQHISMLPVTDVMSRTPLFIRATQLAADAAAMLLQQKAEEEEGTVIVSSPPFFDATAEAEDDAKRRSYNGNGGVIVVLDEDLANVVGMVTATDLVKAKVM